MPPELEGGPPRNIELSSSGVTVLVVAVALGVAAVGALGAFAVARGNAARERVAIEHHGVRTAAEVLRVGMTSGDDRKRFAVYRYEGAGREYTGRVTLRNSDHRPAGPGDRLDIRYLSANPAKSWVEGYEPQGPPVVAMIIVPLACALGGLAMRWSLGRQRYLLEEGRATQARIVEVKRIRHQDRKGYKVEYEFTALSGARKRVKLDARRKPEVDTSVTLLYDRENPRRAAVYPFPLVRVARP
jgi:hypothetical protein